ncbi:MAG: SCO family protein [Acidobacteria bacterium]|nr:SCO family protein [Acidobacteriota bacterium]
MRERHLAALFAATLLVLLLHPDGGSAAAQAKSGASPQSRPNQAEVSTAQKYFTDVTLVNQDGQTMRFYSDLLKDRCVVIDVFFTSCDGVCPVLGEKMAKIQAWLGDRLGKDVYLISLSVDPVTDTPPRLKEYAKRFNAKPGWFFLTGRKENVEFALHKLGQYVEAREDHTNLLLLGNDRTQLWKKAFGLAPTDELLRVVESVVNDR